MAYLFQYVPHEGTRPARPRDERFARVLERLAQTRYPVLASPMVQTMAESEGTADERFARVLERLAATRRP